MKNKIYHQVFQKLCNSVFIYYLKLCFCYWRKLLMCVIPRTNTYYCFFFFFNSCKLKENRTFSLHTSLYSSFIIKSFLLKFGVAFHCVDSHCFLTILTCQLLHWNYNECPNFPSYQKYSDPIKGVGDEYLWKLGPECFNRVIIAVCCHNN